MPRSTLIPILAAASWLCRVVMSFHCLSARCVSFEVKNKTFCMHSLTWATQPTVRLFRIAQIGRIFCDLRLLRRALALAQVIRRSHKDGELAAPQVDALTTMGVSFMVEPSGFRVWQTKLPQPKPFWGSRLT